MHPSTHLLTSTTAKEQNTPNFNHSHPNNSRVGEVDLSLSINSVSLGITKIENNFFQNIRNIPITNYTDIESGSITPTITFSDTLNIVAGINLYNLDSPYSLTTKSKIL